MTDDKDLQNIYISTSNKQYRKIGNTKDETLFIADYNPSRFYQRLRQMDINHDFSNKLTKIYERFVYNLTIRKLEGE